LRLQGRLDRGALQAALDRVVARHEGLRTVFARDGQTGAAQQVVGPVETGWAMSFEDLSGLAPQAGEEQVQAQAREEARAPFDLAAGPLVRGRLLRLSDEAHVLLLTMHHIVSDGWSLGVLLREVAALYGAFVQGQADPLPPLAIQYADYAVWQRDWLQGEVLEQQLAFWQGHLSGAPALLELPSDRPRPAQQSYRGAALRAQV
ncbi:condensation domain-containing protein, partial [Cognatiluteimonas telluris]|uniref:condensation domain-containing protein n=1 Tax=Cognatiluteimonas telluris TaxID=1104775 RepID=UPI00140A9297